MGWIRETLRKKSKIIRNFRNFRNFAIRNYRNLWNFDFCNFANNPIRFWEDFTTLIKVLTRKLIFQLMIQERSLIGRHLLRLDWIGREQPLASINLKTPLRIPNPKSVQPVLAWRYAVRNVTQCLIKILNVLLRTVCWIACFENRLIKDFGLGWPKVRPQLGPWKSGRLI